MYQIAARNPPRQCALERDFPFVHNSVASYLVSEPSYLILAFLDLVLARELFWSTHVPRAPEGRQISLIPFNMSTKIATLTGRDKTRLDLNCDRTNKQSHKSMVKICVARVTLRRTRR